MAKNTVNYGILTNCQKSIVRYTPVLIPYLVYEFIIRRGGDDS